MPTVGLGRRKQAMAQVPGDMPNLKADPQPSLTAVGSE